MLRRRAEPKVSGMEPDRKRKRRRYSELERQQLLASWRSSGESALAFGKSQGVHASNLIRWAAGVGAGTPGRRRRRSSKTGFVELRPTAARSADARDTDRAHLEIECPNGLRLRASRDIDVERLARLVSAVGGLRPC